MTLKMEHNCICVTDLDRTIRFYEEALQLTVRRRKSADDREIVFLGSDLVSHQIEVIRMKDHPGPYELGENPTHLAFRADDIDAAREFHTKMGCFHHDLPAFGVYFIQDPDGYLCEIMPTRR